MNKQLLITGTLLGLFALGCGPTGDGDPTLSLNVDGLETLGAGYVYEGWVIVDGAPVSAGRFNLAAGQTDYALSMDADVLNNAAAYVLTIEPEVGDDPAPSHTHVLAGDFADGIAALSVGHAAALADDYTSAWADYILETPTSMSITSDYNQGIWFYNPGTSMVTLGLPTLPQGWEYEGWVVGANGPVSTGRFVTNGIDSDGAGPTAGGDGFPPAPGQDFITPAVDLVGQTAVITVEPQPDDSAAPFALKPLIDHDIEDVGAGVAQALGNEAANLPTGTASF